MKVMLVEDEAIVGLMMLDQLSSIGHEVCELVVSGEDAVRRARTERPDFIIMDVHLAGHMNGIEAARLILAERRVPIIFITGYSKERILDEVKELGLSVCLEKPIEIEDLEAMFEHMSEGDNTLPA